MYRSAIVAGQSNCPRAADTAGGIGRLLNAYLHSLPDVDSTLRAVLPPLRDCTPNQLQESITLLLNRHRTPPGLARWATHLLTNLAPLLDWNLVLAHACFADPTVPARTSEIA